ncbi:MAG: hypothetical protein JWO42_608 [Chloroflexi bacterium]|nr:hypothetical protein [Chloroflexota bacterium]
MHGVIRQYRVDSSQVAEIVRRVGEGFVPLISDAPGFISYAILDAGTAGLLTISFFEDEAMADESVMMAATWIKGNLVAQLPDPPQVTRGRVTLRDARENRQFGAGVIRRYTRVDSRRVDDITQLVSEGLLPMIASTPGFAVYSLLDAGSGVLVSLSAFADRAAADTSNRDSVEWVKKNLADLLPNPPEVITGDIKLRTGRAVAAKT